MGRNRKELSADRLATDWLTLPQAAAQIGVSRPRVWQLIASGRLPEPTVIWGVCVLPRAAVDSFERHKAGRPLTSGGK